MLAGVQTCSPIAARAELRRILGSAQFHASERNRRFLEYVVEEALAGRAARIKAYSIATDVFGRGPAFNPQDDPIVRIEARQLRRALERFYLLEGTWGPLRIAMPTGTYVPEFRNPAEASDLPIAAAGGPELMVFVAPFEFDTQRSGIPNLGRLFARQLALELSVSPHLRVFTPTCTQGTAAANLEADFVLTGGVDVFSDRVCATAMLLDGHTGQIVRGETMERELRPGRDPDWRDVADLRDRLTSCARRLLDMSQCEQPASAPRPGAVHDPRGLSTRNHSNAPALLRPLPAAIVAPEERTLA